MQHHYHGHGKIPHQSIPGWSDVFNFLFDLCNAFKFHDTSNKYSFPSLHCARWNSRAIFALFIAYFFAASISGAVIQFISNSLATIWFSTQHFKPPTENELLVVHCDMSCNKAIATFQRYWSGENLY